MAGVNGESIKVVPYDTSEFDFISPIKAALGLGPYDELSRLHEKFELASLVTRETDSTTDIHKLYYQNIAATNFYSVYRRFLRDVVSRLFGGPLIVQRVPSFRAHLPGNKSVGEYHRDRDYGHQVSAINFWVPVTDAYDTNTVHVKPDGSDSPCPINVKFGEVLAIDAVNLLHGNEINRTGSTRVSFDFRVIPETDYVDSSQRSVNTLSRLALGDYYVRAEEL